MVGGRQDVFDRMKPILEKMGASVVLCGGIGAGNVTKLCNQIVVAVNIAAVSEALTLGQKAGVSPDAIYRAIRGGLAGSTVMDAKAPMMMDRNFKPGFRIDLHIKDLNNVLDTAKAVDAPTLLTSQVMEMMKVLHHDGEGQSDHSALVKFYEKLSGETIGR
jgi:2-hydroxy-3-oxopropionate reductase